MTLPPDDPSEIRPDEESEPQPLNSSSSTPALQESSIDDPLEIDEEEDDDEEEDEKGETIKVVFVSLLAIAILVFLAWLYLPVLRNRIAPRATPTLSAPTPTLRPSNTPTLVPSATPQPSPTATTFPQSAFLVDRKAIDPAVPVVRDTAYVITADQAIVEPPLSDLTWTSSETIANQLGVLIPGKYYATYNPGSVTWRLDQPLLPGPYELYVMDTLYSSSGELDFSVKLGERILQPLSGLQRINFQSIRFDNPPQGNDRWRSIGIFNVDSADLLSVSTQWRDRDEYNVVGIDRVLIVPLPQSANGMLAGLPADRTRFILDERAAVFNGVEVMLTDTEKTAWNAESEIINSPDTDVRVVWEFPDRLPIGQYEVVVWVPENEGDAPVTYRIFINDQYEPRSDGADLTFQQGKRPGGAWISLGSWQTPRIYEKPVKIAVEMSIPGNTSGQAGVDAVALLYNPTSTPQ